MSASYVHVPGGNEPDELFYVQFVFPGRIYQNPDSGQIG